MHVCTGYGMPYRPLMELVLKLMAHLTDAEPADAKDVLINTLQRIVPALLDRHDVTAQDV